MIKNQKGYTLVMVLLIIVIIGIMAPVLIGSVLNSAKQNKITEEQIQLNHIADMGLTYFQGLANTEKNSITEDIQGNLSRNPNYQLTKEEAIRILNNYLFLSKTIPITGHQKYQYTVTVEQDKINEISNGVEIYYTSAAKNLSDGNAEIPPKEGKLTITLDGVDTSSSGQDNTTTPPSATYPVKPSQCIQTTSYVFTDGEIYPDTCVSGDAKLNNSDNITINGTLYVDGNLVLDNGNGSGNGSGNGNTTTLTVKGNLIVTGKLIMGNHTKVIVNNGNGYIDNFAMKSNDVSVTIVKTLYSKTNLSGTAGISANDYQVLQ